MAEGEAAGSSSGSSSSSSSGSYSSSSEEFLALHAPKLFTVREAHDIIGSLERVQAQLLAITVHEMGPVPGLVRLVCGAACDDPGEGLDQAGRDLLGSSM